IRRMTDAAAHDWYSISLWAAGHPDEALQEVDLAHRRDPLSGCRGQEPWQWRAAIRMSHLGNSSSKCDPSQSCPSPRLGHPTKIHRVADSPWTTGNMRVAFLRGPCRGVGGNESLAGHLHRGCHNIRGDDP